VYHVIPRQTPVADKTAVKAENGEMQNEFYCANFDLKTGALTSLRLNQDNWNSVGDAANAVAEQKDNGDVWELYHNLDGFQNVIMTRPLMVPIKADAHFTTDEPGKPGILSHGPVFSEVEVTHPFGSNTFTTRARLYAGVARLDIETKILNRDKLVRYRLLVPTGVHQGHNFQEIPFGAIERPMSQEFPAQNWMDYSDNHHGLTLVNVGMPGNNVSENTMMLSLMRSTRIQEYGGLDPSNGSDSALELGKELTLHYALVPHAGDWRDAHAYRAGLELNNPLIVHKAAPHPGTLPREWGFLEVSPANVVLSAVKPAKDGETIIRVYEADGRATKDASIKLHGKVLFASEAGLMEESTDKTKGKNDTVRFDLHPFEIKTFKVRLEIMNSGGH